MFSLQSVLSEGGNLTEIFELGNLESVWKETGDGRSSWSRATGATRQVAILCRVHGYPRGSQYLIVQWCVIQLWRLVFTCFQAQYQRMTPYRRLWLRGCLTARWRRDMSWMWLSYLVQEANQTRYSCSYLYCVVT